MSAGERGYSHSMLREILEQPEALRRTLAAFTTLQGERLALHEDLFSPAFQALAGQQGIVIAASGSSRHAGLVAEILFEDMAGLPVDVEYASEYIYRAPQAHGDSGFLVLSQSGETADTLQALEEAHQRGLPTIAITNNRNSHMARLAHCTFTTEAGVERAIPATKSFTTQLLLVHLLVLFAARVRGRLQEEQVKDQLQQIAQLPALLERMLPVWEQQMQLLVQQLGQVPEYLFLGRSVHLPIAFEAALKLKESAYVHAEAYPAGELKHGPNAVVRQTSAVFVLATQDATSAESALRYGKIVSLLRDLKEQGTRLFAIATEGDTLLPQLCEEVIFVPPCPEALAPMLEVVPLQLLAYWTAVGLGLLWLSDLPRFFAGRR